uniref:hypothetical protein n=1 Tax=Paenarthrobacter ureafaciens TaxID=37931 RepID=UPI003F490EF2
MLARVQGTSIADQARHAVSIYIMERILSDDLDAQVAKAKERFATAVAAVRADTPPLVNTEAPAKVTGNQMSIRLDQLQLSKLTALSLVDDDTLADQLRQAFETYVAKQSDDERLVRAKARLDQEDSIRADLFNDPQTETEHHTDQKHLIHASAHTAAYSTPAAIEALDY